MGDKLAETITKTMATWKFIFAFLGGCVVWMVLNITGVLHVDPFPFILLNLCLSLIAAIQGSIIMIHQKREVAAQKIAEDKRDEMLVSILQIQETINTHIVSEESKIAEIYEILKQKGENQ